MGSHSDDDNLIAPKQLRELAEQAQARSIAEHLANLERRALGMSERQQNVVTAGHDGEQVLHEAQHKGFLIRRMPDDPDRVLRISVGAPEWDRNQAYLVFRGKPDAVCRLLERSLGALRRALRDSP